MFLVTYFTSSKHISDSHCTAEQQVVQGTKKWITNGTFCDYFVTAVRTGTKPGGKSISLLLINRDEPGVDMDGFETKVP